MRKLDLVGQRFTRLLVLERKETKKYENGGAATRYLCRCDCGKELIVHTGGLRSGHSKSCGCLTRKSSLRKINIMGMKFGQLTVMAPAQSDKRGKAHWVCECECGNQVIVSSSNLRNGWTQSCGCLQRLRAATTQYKHGHSIRKNGYTRTYITWLSMRRRCNDPNATQYKWYGGRGIRICDRWKDFNNFLADMGERPPGMTIDRFPDNNGNYEPGNCRWATQKQQVNNSRTVLDS